MSRAVSSGKSSPSRNSRESGDSPDESSDAPNLSERARSGMKIASQLNKAAQGAKVRKALSLWRVSRELPTAAAGAGEFFKRHPVPISILAGALTTATLLVLASGMGAFDGEPSAGAESNDTSDEGHEDEEAGEAREGE